MHSDAGCERAKSVHEDCSAHRRPAPRPGRIAAHAHAERGRTVAANRPQTGRPGPSPQALRAYVARAAPPGRRSAGAHPPERPAGPAPRLGAPAAPARRSTSPSVCGRWPRARVVRAFEPPPSPYAAGHRGRGPGRDAGPGGPGGAARDRRLRRVDRRQAGGHGGARREADDLRAGRGHGRARRASRRRGGARPALPSPTATASRRPACTGG